MNTEEQLAEAEKQRDEWKRSHYHVCKKLTACENDRDFNAELCEKAQKQRDTLAEALRKIAANPGDCDMETGFTSGHIARAALATLDH